MELGEHNVPESFEEFPSDKVVIVSGEYLPFQDGLPNGLLYKYYTGLGATYSEFHADRNSIVVFPYRPLAWEKHIKYDAFFVGTDPNEKSTDPEEIVSHINKNKNGPKKLKFAVVAESLRKLIDSIKKAGQDPYTDYFLVLDEVEILQFHSSFRDLLPLCLDYFLEFERKCMVSATMLSFSRAEINELDKYHVEVTYDRNPDLRIIRTKKDPHLVTANRLVDKIKNETAEEKNQKYLIGINSMKGIRQILSIFEKAGIDDISVSCSENSKRRFNKEFTSKSIKNGVLHAKINIATSAFWSGIDIEENFIPYAVCLNTELHHFFSFENLIQFQGRCRKLKNYPLRLILPEKIDSTNFEIEEVATETRIEELEKLLSYLNHKISSRFDREKLKKALAKGKTGIFYEGIEENIPKINWLLMDLAKYKQNLVSDIIDKAEGLISKLKLRFNILSDEIDSDQISFFPDKDEVLYEKDYKNFLTHLSYNEPDSVWIRNILENPQVQNKVASYWYLFGKKAFKNHEKAYSLAVSVSQELPNCSNYSKALIDMVRFYLDHPNQFENLKDAILQLRPSSGKSKNNVAASSLVEALKREKDHFPSFFKNTNEKNSVMTKRSKIILEQFFKINPENPKANKKKYKVEEKSQLQPFGGDEQFLNFVEDFRKMPVNSSKLSVYNSNSVSLIRTDFL
ncbi:MAG: hypothetical protein C0433_19170 [Cyclobacterium sp.]|nr:hypothetical protein [Cyclobacterium sp.]